jgi:hypothetical protein
MPWSLPSAIKRVSVSSSQKTCQLSYPAILEPHQSKVSDHARFGPALLGILASFLAVTPSQGQVATAVSVFQTKTQAAISSGKPFSGVTLVANADWVAGSTHENGTAKLKAGADGSGSLQLDIGDASRTELQTKSDASRSCTWTDHAGKSHDILGPNCLIAMPWFAPSLFTQPLTLLPVLLGTTDAGDVVKDGVTLHQISYQLNLTGADSASTQRVVRQSTVQVFYDPQTFLPQSLEYAVHPDNDDLQDIPVKVLFSNYQASSGVMLPFHIERYLNRTLQLTLDVTSASIE